MPEKSTIEKAKEDLREGKSPQQPQVNSYTKRSSTSVEGKHGARSPQQAIAIGLSKARRAGIPLKPPRRGQALGERSDTRRTRLSARPDLAPPQAIEVVGRVPLRSALKREPRSSASHSALSAAGPQRRSASQPVEPLAGSPSRRFNPHEAVRTAIVARVAAAKRMTVLRIGVCKARTELSPSGGIE